MSLLDLISGKLQCNVRLPHAVLQTSSSLSLSDAAKVSQKLVLALSSSSSSSSNNDQGIAYLEHALAIVLASLPAKITKQSSTAPTAAIERLVLQCILSLEKSANREKTCLRFCKLFCAITLARNEELMMKSILGEFEQRAEDGYVQENEENKTLDIYIEEIIKLLSFSISSSSSLTVDVSKVYAQVSCIVSRITALLAIKSAQTRRTMSNYIDNEEEDCQVKSVVK